MGFLGDQEAQLYKDISTSILRHREALLAISRSNERSQKSLNLWTRVMAFAVVGQIIAIVVLAVLGFK